MPRTWYSETAFTGRGACGRVTRRFPDQPVNIGESPRLRRFRVSAAHEHHFQRKIDTVESLRAL